MEQTRDTFTEKFAEVEKRLEAAVQEYHLPGLAAGIVVDGELVFSKCYGHADIDKNVPVTTDTIFRIGSISKTMTAIGIMQLWEQGKLDLDSPVNQYLKSYRVAHPDSKAAPITIRHLLTHTSGIGMVRSWKDLFHATAYLGLPEGKPFPPLGEFYSGWLKAMEYPERRWSYANHAFATLGQVVEEVSGQPFAEYMLEHLFEPLGMTHSDYLRRERVRELLAVGYGLKGKQKQPKPVPFFEIMVMGAGSVFSDLNDMAKYVAALMNGGTNQHGAILKPDTLAMMFQPNYQLDPLLMGMGLSFILDSIGEHRVVWHNGGWPGFSSSMWIVPDAKIGVILFSNLLNEGLDKTSKSLLHLLFDVPEEQADTGAPESPELWPELVGYYAPEKGFLMNLPFWIGFGGGGEISIQDGHLTLGSLIGPIRKGVRLYPIAGNPLAFRYALQGQVNTVIFRRNAAGKIDHVDQETTRVYRRPTSHSLRFRLKVAALLLAVLALWIVGNWVF